MHEPADLVTRARSGDHAAFAALVRRFQDMAVAYAYARLHDLHLAEDAAQEAFLDAHLHLDQLREPAAFPGWFRRIVLKHTDRLTRGKTVKLEPLERALDAPSDAIGHQESLERGRKRDRLWSALDALPEHERSAVLLYYFGDHTQDEVGAFLEVPETTVKKRLFTARRRLRAMLMDLVTDTLRASRPSRDDAFADGVLALLGAARAGDTSRVEALLRENRRLIAARDWLGNSALVVAVNSGHIAVAELLLATGVPPDIHESAACGFESRVRTLLDEDPARLDAWSAEGFTPLALAAHYGHLGTTRLLLERGADANAVSRHPLEVTPLHAALFGRQVETARLLIERGADVRARRGGKGRPRAGWTPLHYAMGLGLTELVEPLLARGADPAARDAEGSIPSEPTRKETP